MVSSAVIKIMLMKHFVYMGNSDKGIFRDKSSTDNCRDNSLAI